MTQTSRSPVAVLITLAVATLLILPAAAAPKKSSKSTPAKSARQEPKSRSAKERAKGTAKTKSSAKGRDQSASKSKASAREREKSAAKSKASARDTRAGRRGSERASKNDRRSARDEKRERASAKRGDDRKSVRKSSRSDDAVARSGRKLSRRERLAEARREAERRRREEAARRAEIARQAAIARALAIARQRAADQALRDETAANILRDDPTGEDPEVRRVAVEALGERAGSVVVMDPKNGRVYAVVNQEWALRRGNVPCSTIKLVTGMAGLADKVIDPVQTVNISDGSYRLDLTDSLAYSNNAYFQKVGGYVGFERMMSYAREFGLGEKTGINHPNESAGRLPLLKTGYAVNHMSSHGDDIEVTTVQLANMASAIGNGGTLLVPHLPRTPQESVTFKAETRRRLNVPQEHLRRLLPGMIGAVTYGTGRNANDPTQTVAGKTGTCTGQGSKVGLFTSFAPVHDARLAVAVVTRGSGERGRTASSVAGKIYRGLNHRFGNGGAAPLLATDALAPRPKIDPSKAAAISDEDREADAYVVSEAAGEEKETNVRSTLAVPTKPAGVTPSPARTPATTSTPTPPAPTTSTPLWSTPERPRRVESNTP